MSTNTPQATEAVTAVQCALARNGLQLPPPAPVATMTVTVRKESLRMRLLPPMFKKRDDGFNEDPRLVELAWNGLRLPL